MSTRAPVADKPPSTNNGANNQLAARAAIFVGKALAASFIDELNRSEVNETNNSNRGVRINFSRVALGTVNNVVQNGANNLAKKGLLGSSCPCPFWPCAFDPFNSACSQCDCGYD